MFYRISEWVAFPTLFHAIRERLLATPCTATQSFPSTKYLHSDCNMFVIFHILPFVAALIPASHDNHPNRNVRLVLEGREEPSWCKNVIYYHKYLYMFRAPICPSSRVQVVYYCIWCSAL